MSEELTISQLAKELNVSRQKIYRFLEKPENCNVHQYIYTNSKSIKMINPQGIKYIKENIQRTRIGQDTDSGQTKQKHINKGFESKSIHESVLNSRTKSEQESDSDRTVFLINQIEQKDSQIQTLQQIVEKNQNLLDQQQRLALQDKKLLEEYKAEINYLKALSMNSQNTQEEQVKNQPPKFSNQTETYTLKKKWYQFWK